MARRLSQEERLARYRADVEGCQKQTKNIRGDWERYAKFYANDQWVIDGANIKPEEGVVVNQVAPIINTILPSITTQPPKLRVTPLRPQDVDRAPLVEAMLQFEWRRLDVTSQLRLATLDMLVYGMGWLKVGYEFSEVEVPRDPNEIEMEVQQLLSQVQDAQTLAAMQQQFTPFGANLTRGFSPSPQGPEFGDVPAPSVDAQTGVAADLASAMPQQPLEQMPAEPPMSPQEASDLPTEDEIRAAVPTTETIPEKDDIFVERVSPLDVYVDPEAKTLDSARWIAHRMVKPIEEVKADPLYSNTKNLKGTMSATHLAKGDSSQLVGDHGERVVLWEFYDLRNRKICVFADGHDKFLLETDYLYPFEHSPFVLMQDYWVPDSLYAMGEVKLIEQAQVELNKTRTQMLSHNRRFNRKILFRPEAFDEDGKAALKSNKDGVMVPLARGQNPSEAIMPIPDSPLPTDRYQIAQMVAEDIQRISGITDYQRGGNTEIRRTATEAAMINSSSSLRQMDKLDRVERAATEVGRKMKALAQLYYDRDRWILVTGNGLNVPLRFSNEDIKGEYDVSVDAGSTQPINDALKIQQAERMYQLMRPDPLVNETELLKQVLLAYNVKDPERFIKQPQMMPPEVPPEAGGGFTPGAPGAQPGATEGALPSPDQRQQSAQAGAAAAGVPQG